MLKQSSTPPLWRRHAKTGGVIIRNEHTVDALFIDVELYSPDVCLDCVQTSGFRHNGKYRFGAI